MARARCFLARFSDRPCDGRLIKAHLIPRQLLTREGHARAIHDPRSFVMACGGPTGCSGHHGMLDYSRTLRIPRHALPPAVEELAAELDARVPGEAQPFAAYLARTYGER